MKCKCNKANLSAILATVATAAVLFDHDGANVGVSAFSSSLSRPTMALQMKMNDRLRGPFSFSTTRSTAIPATNYHDSPDGHNCNYLSQHKFKPSSPSPLSTSTQLHASASASGSSSSSNESNKKKNLIAISSTFLLIALDVTFRRIFTKFSISFPSSLGGCGILFTTLLALSSTKSTQKLADGLYGTLSPGAVFLAKWLPVFFVPSLVTLPLAQSLGSGMEVVKVISVIVAGFYFTLFSTSLSVLGVGRLLGKGGRTDDDRSKAVATPDDDDDTAAAEKENSTPAAPPKPFSDRTFTYLSYSTITTFILSTLLSILKPNASPLLRTPLNALTMLCTTLATFVFGAIKIPKNKITKFVHPLVTCTSLTWIATKLLSLINSTSFLATLKSYKVGSLCPVHLGAGDVLLFLLGPAVLSLAIQMYERRKLMRENIYQVSTGIIVSSVGGLFGTASMVRLLGIKSEVLRLCLLSRNITSPLAMSIASIVGADTSLAVSMVVLTGLLGANFGASILDGANIKDPVARGLGIGAAAHGLGTAAFRGEEDAFPFAAIGMALTATLCTVLVSLGGVRSAVIKLALGV